MTSQTTRSGKQARCDHRGDPVKVGKFTLLAGGTLYFQPGDLNKPDVWIALTPLSEFMQEFGTTYTVTIPCAPQAVTGEDKPTSSPARAATNRTPALKQVTVLSAVLPDFGGVPTNWQQFLEEQVIPLLEEAHSQGKSILASCIGSHGRTGTLIASLIALLEPGVADPITEARLRHCQRAVETYAQAQGIFALRGLPVPAHHRFHV